MSKKEDSIKPQFKDQGQMTVRYENGSQDLLSMSEVREDAG